MSDRKLTFDIANFICGKRNFDIQSKVLAIAESLGVIGHDRPVPFHVWGTDPLNSVLRPIFHLAPIQVWVAPSYHDIAIGRQCCDRVVHPWNRATSHSRRGEAVPSWGRRIV